jgi:hypothetical protein
LVQRIVSTRKQRGFAALYIEFGPVVGHFQMECALLNLVEPIMDIRVANAKLETWNLFCIDM